MNTGAFGEGFPYTNFHDLNTDWLIKIAKDFLDQYTHIQEIIEEGEEGISNLTQEELQALEEKKDELEQALQEWYNEHSEDIDNELATAIADFSTASANRAREAIESIPSDYTALYNMVVSCNLHFGKPYNGHLAIYKPQNSIAIIGTSPVLIMENGTAFNTQLTVNQAYPLDPDGRTLEGLLYCTIVFDKANRCFKLLRDYTGSYDNYIIIGYWDHENLYGNLGMVLVDNKVENDEIEFALRNIDFPDLESLETQVDTISTNLDNEVDNRTREDQLLNQRISNLVINSGSGDAEIVDARTGYDGTIYPTLEDRLNAEEGNTLKRVGNILTVGNNKMYPSINSALTDAQNGDVIILDRGVYEEYISNRDKAVAIVGVSKEECIIQYPNTEYGRPPIEMGMGILKNLTIHAYNNGDSPTTEYGRSYCVHCDFSAYYQQHPPISNYLCLDNVNCINDDKDCVGFGMRQGMKYELLNCSFRTLSSERGAVYVHSGTGTFTNCELIIKNCLIENNSSSTGALHLEGYWTTNGGSTALLVENIVRNSGSGDTFTMTKTTHVGPEVVENWQGISDWLLDPLSQLNNINVLNSSVPDWAEYTEQNQITWIDKNIGNKTLNASGYLNVDSDSPTTPEGFTRFAILIKGFNDASGNPFNITTEGLLIGTPNQVIQQIQLRYIYARNII